MTFIAFLIFLFTALAFIIWTIYAIISHRHLKNLVFKGIRSHDFSDASAMLYQLDWEQVSLLGYCVPVKELINERNLHLKYGLWKKGRSDLPLIWAIGAIGS